MEEFARSDMLNFIQEVMQDLTEATLFENPDDWRVVGKLSLQPVSKVKATCIVNFSTLWLAAPPRIWCPNPWVRREIDWHAGGDGTLCYVLDAEWRDRLQDVATRHDMDGVAAYAAEYLMRNTQWLLQRHLVGYQQNIEKWIWEGWGHNQKGQAEYAAEQRLLKRSSD
jgi:hypothetical protein